MCVATLVTHGDAEERKRWPEVSRYFPLYEPFWQKHVFPLRDSRGRIRADIDERLELMAQEHYKCFVSVSIALDGLGHDDHPERTFSSLQNAANRAKQVIQLFNSVRETCVTNATNPVPVDGFEDYARDTALYRNFVHEDVVGLLQDRDHRRYIPRPDKLMKYRRWSSFHNADQADFLALEDCLRASSTTLSQLLGEHWQRMLELSAAVVESQRYAQLLPPLPQAPEMQPVVLCSNVQLS
jgi:hypothetical protein